MSEELNREFINESRGFTHVVAVSHGGLRTLYVSGQVGWAPEAEGPGDDLAEQAALAFANLDRQLAAAGVTREDVVKLNVFIKDIDPERVRTVGRAQAQGFPTAKLPAATWVGVTGLVDPRLMVEIEAVAVVTES